MTPADAAQAYAARGFNVVPVGPNKAPHSSVLKKVRGSSGWKALRLRPLSVDELHDCYAVAPHAGVGLILDGLVVDDYDHGRPARLPHTPIAVTRRGLHVYHRGEAKTSRTEYGERRGGGDVVVVPPSTHASGHRYSWAVAPLGLGNVFLPDEDFLDLPAPKATPIQDDTYYTCVSRCQSSSETEDTEEFAARALSVMEFRHRSIGSVFCPFHQDRTASAGLHRGDHGGWIFSCRACDVSYRLGTAYARSRGARLTRPTIGKWALRLLVETGVLGLPPLALDLTMFRGATRKYLEGFLFLFRLESLTTDVLAGTPFTESFAVPWCGISKSSVLRARGELISCGWMRESGWLDAPGLPTRRWLPGDHVLAAMSSTTARGDTDWSAIAPALERVA